MAASYPFSVSEATFMKPFLNNENEQKQHDFVRMILVKARFYPGGFVLVVF